MASWEYSNDGYPSLVGKYKEPRAAGREIEPHLTAGCVCTAGPALGCCSRTVVINKAVAYILIRSHTPQYTPVQRFRHARCGLCSPLSARRAARRRAGSRASPWRGAGAAGAAAWHLAVAAVTRDVTAERDTGT